VITLLYVWWRAFSIVSMTALNVTQVTQHHYGSAFLTGSVLSFIWWANTRTAAHSNVVGAQFAYTLGAGCGTVFGMYLGSLLQ
jgi:hypothetical protein